MTARLTSKEFWDLMKTTARSTSEYRVRDTHAELRHDLLRLSSHIVQTDGVSMVHGHNVVRRDVALSGEDQSPHLALQIGLRGSASARHEGLSSPVLSDAGCADLFYSPGGKYDVSLQEGTTNEAFRLNLTPAYFASLTERYPELLGGSVVPLVRGKPMQLGRRRMGPLGGLLDLVDDIMKSDRYGSLRSMFLESKIIELLVRFLSSRVSHGQGPLKPRDVDRMVEARDRLLARMADPPTLAELSRSVGTNEFKLKQDFKILFGQSVHAFALGRRLEHARSLLIDTDRSVSDIAHEVGYAHLSHFSAAFRKRFGTTPSRLRAPRSGGSAGR